MRSIFTRPDRHHAAQRSAGRAELVRKRDTLVFGLTTALSVAAAVAQTCVDIDPTVALDAEGWVDRRVDRQSLARFGVRGDCNDQVPATDPRFLAANESEIDDLLLAFYCVQCGKDVKTLASDGAIRCPLHAYPTLVAAFSGFEPSGSYCARFQRHTEGRLPLDLEPQSSEASAAPASSRSRVQVARSSSGGAPWQLSAPDETTDLNAVDRCHPFLVVANSSTVHAVCYDTRHDLTRVGVELLRAFSTDGAVTWSAPQRMAAPQGDCS